MTRSRVSQAFPILKAFFLLFLPLAGISAEQAVQTHVVSPAELRNQAVTAAQTRRHDLETIDRFLSMPRAAKALEAAGIDRANLKTAVAVLNDKELAQLAARSEQAQADFAAGRMTDRDLLLILIGLAALILIIVAVH
jgi:hypothetical protein